MKEVLLYYYASESGNFGDDLNPWLWSRLLGPLLDGYCYRNRQHERCRETDALLVGIGTILDSDIPPKPRKFVFGSGAGYAESPTVDETWSPYCLRGPETAAKLSLTWEGSSGDAAYLLSHVFQPVTKGNDVGYMPHHSSLKHKVWREVCAEANVRYISPAQDVETVMREVLSCRLVLAEAMHGAIVADIFRIPWIPVKTYGKILETKWHDWLQPLGLKYRPWRFPSLRPKRGGGLIGGFKQSHKRRRATRMLQELASREDGQLSSEDSYAKVTEELVRAFKRMKCDIHAFKNAAD